MQRAVIECCEEEATRVRCDTSGHKEISVLSYGLRQCYVLTNLYIPGHLGLTRRRNKGVLTG
jgi:hypothetical protein